MIYSKNKSPDEFKNTETLQIKLVNTQSLSLSHTQTNIHKQTRKGI